MERKDIEVKYTWDLSQIYSSIDEFENDYHHATRAIDEIKKYEGKLTENEDTFLYFFGVQTVLNLNLLKMYQYAHLYCDVEPNNQEMQTLLARVLNLFDIANIALTFVDLELIKNKNRVLELLKDKKLTKYKFLVEQTLREADHKLSDEMENMLSEVDQIADNSYKVFNALRLEYKPVHVNGKEEFLNAATLSEFLKNANPEVRKEAYENFFSEYKKYENVFALTLSGVNKKDAFYAKARKFNSSLEASLFKDNAPKELFDKILHMANVKYRPLFHKYVQLKKDILEIEDFYNYDLSIPLVTDYDKKFTIEECFELINEAVAPLGNDYVAIINKAIEERWIDYMPHVGKRSGAYSAGSYETNPYILMSFIGDYSSLSTLIHELGHSCHSYLANKNQDPLYADYKIFVAEVASTVNEVLLSNLMLRKAKTKEEKSYLLYNLLEECVGLIFRQPMFADFEHKLHVATENNESLSSKAITDLYRKLNEEYFGDVVKMHDLVGYSCYYIPHFYYNYYVYKYTLGMCVSLAIVSRILKGDEKQVENYLTFLKSGGSKYPIDLLKLAGVDVLDDQVYIDAFEYFDDLLNQFTEIMK